MMANFAKLRSGRSTKTCYSSRRRKVRPWNFAHFSRRYADSGDNGKDYRPTTRPQGCHRRACLSGFARKGVRDVAAGIRLRVCVVLPGLQVPAADRPVFESLDDSAAGNQFAAAYRRRCALLHAAAGTIFVAAPNNAARSLAVAGDQRTDLAARLVPQLSDEPRAVWYAAASDVADIPHHAGLPDDAQLSGDTGPRLDGAERLSTGRHNADVPHAESDVPHTESDRRAVLERRRRDNAGQLQCAAAAEQFQLQCHARHELAGVERSTEQRLHAGRKLPAAIVQHVQSELARRGAAQPVRVAGRWASAGDRGRWWLAIAEPMDPTTDPTFAE